MKMKRELKRIKRKHGIKYFSLPFIVVLFLAFIADGRLSSYLTLRGEVEENGNRIEANLQTLALAKKIESQLATSEIEYTRYAGRVFRSVDGNQTNNELQQELAALLQSVYFENIEFSNFTFQQSGSTNKVTILARFTGVPQQIPRLQAAIIQSSKLLSVDVLELKTVEDRQRNGKQLAITAQFNALHASDIKGLIEMPQNNGKL
jgi:hypothetical protein